VLISSSFNSIVDVRLFRRSLCSYTHPALAPEGSDATAAALPRFPNLKELRRHLSERLQLHFCPVCLEGRKVSRLDACQGMLRMWCSDVCVLPVLPTGLL